MFFKNKENFMPHCPRCEEEFTMQELNEYETERDFKKGLEKLAFYRLQLASERRKVIIWSILSLCVLLSVFYLSSFLSIRWSNTTIAMLWSLASILLIMLSFVFWTVMSIVTYANAENKILDRFKNYGSPPS